MTDISVNRTSSWSEDRRWLASNHGVGPGMTPSVTLDVATFDQAAHYPNGYVPSGIVLGKITATDLYGPYDPEAEDGRDVAAGFLYGSLGIGASLLLGGAIVNHGPVTTAYLPVQAGTGALDDAARSALTHIIFT